MTRREMLRAAVVGGVLSCFNPQGRAMAAALPPLCSGRLLLHSPHTGESLHVAYLHPWGGFAREALARLSHFLRCNHTGETHDIRPELFLLLDALHTQVGASERPLVVTSGYRSPAYNEMLQQNGLPAASNSYHVKGMAADIRIDRVDLKDLETSASLLEMGGVGRYSTFIHVDVGPVRTFTGK